jgi:subtilisin family serine protease
MSMFDISGPVGADIVSNFMSDGEVIARAADALSSAGFTILQVSAYTVNVAAPISTYERAFRTKVVPHELDTIKSGGIHDTATFFSTDGASRFGLISTQGTPFESLIEGVAIETPRYFFAAATAMSPKKAYWHLAVPHDVSLGCNADKAHRSGITGRGIKVAMVDSGHFAHPFFAARGYRVQAVTLGPGSSNPGADENGHGTAESANIFAVAPDVELWPVKINFANSAGAFNAAVGLNPDIITCSWGSDVRNGPLGAADQVLAVAIADAVARGIIVIFSAGNGHFGFPGQHPDVISAGGVYRDELGALRASDYASGFASPIYSGRNAPDLCGLVGLRPRAAYIMLPLQPASTIDSGLSGGTHPNADETASDDGWAAISGTSAAAPQLAGTAALIKQACNSLSPASVRDIMMRTAIDVTTGTCNPASSGAAAAVGVDLATGSGLVDAHAAVLVAKIRCLGPITPIRPIVPIQPIQPIQPITPISPIQPIQPITPIQPISPIQPITPIHPISPIQPIRPIRPIEPIVAQAAPSDALSRTQNTGAVEGAPPGLSPEDLKALEELVIKSNIDPLA